MWRRAGDFRGDVLRLAQEVTIAVVLEDEDGKLKKLVSDLSLDREMLEDVIRRKL